MPPSPMIGSMRMPAVSSPIAASTAPISSGRDLIEAIDRRAKALEMLRLAAGGDGGERPAVKGAFEGDEPVALGRAVA